MALSPGLLVCLVSFGVNVARSDRALRQGSTTVRFSVATPNPVSYPQRTLEE
jgi:hypothetical protein